MQINIHDVTKVDVSSLYRAPVDGSCRFAIWKTITIHSKNGEEIKVTVFFSENEHDSNIGDSKMPNIRDSKMIPEISRFTSNCTAVTIGTKIYYYSYHALVGFENKSDKIRVAPISKTTARHLKEMGIKEFPVAKSDEEFLAFIEKSL